MSFSRILRWFAPLLVAAPLALVLVEGAVRMGLLGGGGLLPMVRIANKKGDPKGGIRPGSLVLLCYPTNYRGYFKIDLADPKTFAYYESIGMRNMDKALPSRHYAVEQQFNSQVYLGPEFPEKRDGVTRVVIMGDSFNMGWGLRPEDRVSARLEKHLNDAQPGKWEVVNAGIPSGDFPELYYKYREILPLKPDILILGMTLNDVMRKPELAQPPLESSPLVMVRRVDEPAKLGFFDLRITLFLDRARQDAADTKVMIDWYRALGSDENTTGIVATRQYIREMDAELKNRGGRFILAMWPLLVPWDKGYPLAEIHEHNAGFAEARGIEFADLLPPLVGHKAEDLWLHPVDRHPNDVASELAATRLAKAILQR
jgi:hypothetical protein